MPLPPFLQRLFGTEKKRGVPPADSGFVTGPTTFFSRYGNAPDHVTQPFSTHAVVYRCVSLISRNLSSIPFELYSGSDSDKETVDSGPWYDLFLRPNPNLTRRTLWEATATFLELPPGDCLWVLEGRGDEIIGESEIPTEIWPISGSCCEPIYSDDKMTIIGWRITSGGGTIELPSHACVHFKLFNPYDPFRGLSPLTAALKGVRQDLMAQEYNTDFYRNGAVPGGVVQFPAEVSMTNEQRAEYRKEFEDRHKGVGKAHRMLVLSHGGQYQNLASSHKEMDFIEGRKFSRDEIAMVYGVPKYLLGVTDEVNYASSVQARRTLWEETILPLSKMMEDTLEAQLFTPRMSPDERAQARVMRNVAIWGEFDTSGVEALRNNMTERLEQAAKLQALGYKLNEINEKLDLGMELQTHGDQVFLPAGLLPLDMVLNGGAGPAFGMQPRPLELPGPTLEDEVNDRAFMEITAQQVQHAKRTMIWNHVREVSLDPLQSTFKSAMGGYFRRRRAEVLKLIEQIDLSRAVDPDKFNKILADLKKRWDEQLQERLTPLYEDSVEVAASSLEAQIGQLKHFSTSSPQVVEFIRDKLINVTDINTTIEKALREALAEGIGKGETMRELQDRVRAIFNMANSRAATIARTESIQITNGARAIAMEAEGIKKTEWISSRDGRVRPTHQILDGEVRKVGESFLEGATLRYPGDPLGPADQTINCRCIAAPPL